MVGPGYRDELFAELFAPASNRHHRTSGVICLSTLPGLGSLNLRCFAGLLRCQKMRMAERLAATMRRSGTFHERHRNSDASQGSITDLGTCRARQFTHRLITGPCPAREASSQERLYSMRKHSIRKHFRFRAKPWAARLDRVFSTHR